MKRKSPFHDDFLVQPPENIIQPFRLVNDSCSEYLFKPSFIPETKFPDNILKIPIFQISPIASTGSSKLCDCDLLPGSQLDANNLFGMEIEHSSHILEIEHSNFKLNQQLESQVKTFPNSEPFSHIIYKRKNLTLNGKSVKNIGQGIKHEIVGDNEKLCFVFGKKKISDVTIESDIPIILEECKINVEFFRVVCPSVTNQAKIHSKFIDFLCFSDFTNSSEIISDNFLLIRSNEVNFKGIVSGIFLLILATRASFSIKNVSFKYATIYAKELFKSSACLSIKHLIIKSDEKIDLIQKGKIETKCTFLQSNTVNINQNVVSPTFSIETKMLNIKKSKIEVEKKMNLLFITSKDDQNVGRNDGIISCHDLFVEMNSEDYSKASNRTFTNYNAISVKNAFLIITGTFSNKGNVSFRSFYVSSFSHFLSKKKSGSIQIGDFMVVEKNSSFEIECRIIPYAAFLRPIFLNSGTTVINSDDTFEVIKFVSNGEIGGNVNIRASDLISLSGKKINAQVLNLIAQKIAICTGSKITVAQKCSFITKSIEMNYVTIQSIGETSENENENENKSENENENNGDNEKNGDNENESENESLNDSNNKNEKNENIARIAEGSQMLILYEDECINNNCLFLGWKSCIIEKSVKNVSDTNDAESCPDKFGNRGQKTENEKKRKNKKNLKIDPCMVQRTPENGSKRKIPDMT